MAKKIMLRRAFHQAVNHHAADACGEKPEIGKIRSYILQYAKKNDVEISQEEVDEFILAHDENIAKY